MSNWKDSLSALCYLIRKPTHTLARKYFFTMCLYVFYVFVCQCLYEYIVCVGGDVLWKICYLDDVWCCMHVHDLNGQYLRSYKLLACNHLYSELVALSLQYLVHLYSMVPVTVLIMMADWQLELVIEWKKSIGWSQRPATSIASTACL